ncbi:hypothetical protein LWI28_006873 [Acer negundo]|uniref:Retrotransposon Copia-like N-terminal domain-containing protein n=1 Tax=Acer negundo TaxID=4023 RepID=A0AAD5NLC9_ACENE|nr:hypothetical protein LWI28_006873 [Acer negundo]
MSNNNKTPVINDTPVINTPPSTLIKTNAYTTHHSDSPSIILVTPLLSGDNYGPWNRAVTMALRAKISSEIRPSILYAETAAQIWMDLKDRFSQSNALKIYQLKQSISALKQEGLSVSLYFTHLKSLWDELSSIVSITPCIYGNAKSNIDQQHQDRAMEFLQGLHDRFSTIRSQILLMEPFPSIQRIYNMVRQEEKQQEIHDRSIPTIDSATLKESKPSFRSSGKCRRPFYEHYNKHGHTFAMCFQIHGFLDKHVKTSTPISSTSATSATQLTPAQYTKLLAILAKEESGGSSAHLVGPINEEEDWSG